MRITKRLLFYLRWKVMILGCITFQQFAVAQNQITFRQLSVKEGLSQNSAISVTQDSIGYLWVATQDGLNRYDGRKFTTYPFTFVDITRDDYSNLGDLYTDRSGNLWIIPMDKKLYRYNRPDNTFDAISGIENVSTIYQDVENSYWIGTYSNGLFKMEPETFQISEVLSSEKVSGTIFSIAQQDKKSIVLATENKIIQYSSESSKISITLPKSLDGLPIQTNFSVFEKDTYGRQWIGTYGDGLYFRKNNEQTFHRISELSFNDVIPLDLNILDLHLDRKDRLWIATYGRGLYLIDFKSAKIDHFGPETNNPKAVHYNDILCIYEDNSGTMWFGTDGAGLSFYDEYLEKFNSFSNFQTPEGINIDVVRSIAVDHTGNIWIGTSGKGLTRYEPDANSWSTFRKEDNTSNTVLSNRIMSLLVDDDGDLWIGAQGEGLSIKAKNGTFRHYNKNSEPPLPAATIWTIFENKQGQYWLGSRENGLFLFDKNKGVLKNYNHRPDDKTRLPGNNIRTITEDDSGNLWIGTDGEGLVKFTVEAEEFTTYKNLPDHNSLSNNSIKSLYYASNNILWIGTNGSGLNALDIASEKFYSFTTEEGLANNVIYGILPDSNGDLWLSSNKGITKFRPADSWDEKYEIRNYNNYAGLATEFNTGAYHKDKAGNLYFGGLDGIYWFQPAEIRENTFLPKTTITSFIVLNKSTPIVNNTILKHNENTISFTFSSLQFALPEKNQYKYKLKNFDAQWVDAGNNDFARYPYLSPGDYEFRVKSSNYDGIWNESPDSFKFTIKSPWYFSTLAKIIYGLLFLLGLFAIYTYLKWRWKMKLNLQLKEDETKRLKKLNDFKSKLYTDISHEFRTPLTLIAGPIDEKIGQGNLSDADFASFSMIKRNTNRLLSLTQQLLDLAKLDKGKLKLKVTKNDLGLFLNTLASSFEYSAKSKHISYTVKVAPTHEVWYDEDSVEKIVSNLLSNAMKYTTENGSCSFTETIENNEVVISVKNTILDVSAIDPDKLFTRFYQKDELAEGAGVGLSLVRELVHLHHGSVEVKLEEKDMIHFKVILPVNKLSFSSNEIVEPSNEKRVSFREEISQAIILDDHSYQPNENGEDLPLLLLVEDHNEVRKFVASVLKHKYRVFEAHNGKVGIDKAIEIVPDIIISDVRMPITDGIELCNTLKTDERTSHIPIILLTAGIGEENELKGLKSGADDFVTKPFKFPILETRIDNLIEIRRALRNRYSKEMVLKPKDIAVTTTDELFLEKLQKVLDEHLNDTEFNAALFGEKVGMSRMQLHRKLIAFTGLSTTAFIRSQRLKQALHILKSSDATVNEVAYTVGFNTPSYFIKCFKEVYHKTPSEFIQSPSK